VDYYIGGTFAGPAILVRNSAAHPSRQPEVYYAWNPNLNLIRKCGQQIL